MRSSLSLLLGVSIALAGVTVGARTIPRRGAVRKPRGLAIQAPFPCGTQLRVNCGYGPRCSPAHRRVASVTSTNDHYALDLIRAEPGNGERKPVVAVAAGVVKFAGWTRGGWAPYGQLVYIEHDYRDRAGHRYQSLYGHLARVTVRAGQRVAAGDRIGLLGGSSSGRQGRFGAHLHFALYQDARPALGGGRAVVPEPLDDYEDLGAGVQLVACQPPGPLTVASVARARRSAGGLTQRR
jgi:murein DD-endopeptidase MepM/ murein hydrolase activator NlpD